MVTMRNTENVSDAEYVELVLAAKNAGRDWFRLVGEREAPLSGEWSGEAIPEISERYDLDLFDSDLADAFEDGFFELMLSEIVREDS